MRKFLPGIIAIIVAISLSAFTLLGSKHPTLDEYFGNLGTHASPNWVYIGTSDPGAGVCFTNPSNDCIGKSTAGHDSNGHPLGSVTVVRTGTYNP